MWASKSSFFDRPCPEAGSCRIPNCIFAHNVAPAPQKQPATYGPPPLERTSLTKGSESRVNSPSQPFVGSLAPKPKPQSDNDTITSKTKTALQPTRAEQIVQSAKRAISPPQTSRNAASAPSTAPAVQPKKEEKEETLKPRVVPKDPAQYLIRRALLLKLHEYMSNLNQKVSNSTDQDTKALELSRNEVIRMAVDEEEDTALSKPSVYQNVIKMRIAALKKKTMADWVEDRKKALAKEQAANASKKPPEPVNTGLNPEEEIKMCSRLVVNQKGLDSFGYVTKQPAETAVQSARKGVEDAQHWEKCDRCSTRFQVFPDRREDGALTTGGQCKYHWGRKYYPKKQKGELVAPATRMSCCGDVLGSQGCVTSDTHVFKVSAVHRLAAILPFKETPFNPNTKSPSAVCFDCEMGYTCCGLELIRLTAVSWPSHQPIIDVLVRPLGAVLDLNTRYSGVTPDQFFNAPAFDPNNPTVDPNNLQIMSSPQTARELLLTYVSSDTLLLGHALENDLNSVRLIHPNIVDTVMLFPHPRGLPLRHGLRNLAKGMLHLDIQQAGATGHDSLEDARATGELVRFKVMKEWKKLQLEGWQVRDGEFFPPLPPNAPGGPVSTSNEPAPLPPADIMVAAEAARPMKRKLGEDDGKDGEGKEEPDSKIRKIGE